MRATTPEPEINRADQPTVPNLPASEPPPETPVFEPIAMSDAPPTGEPAPPPEQPTQPPPRSEPSWISPTPPGDYQPPSQPFSTTGSEGSGGNNRVWWIIGIIVLLFFLACCCLAVILVAVASSDSALHDELNTATAGLVALIPSPAR